MGAGQTQKSFPAITMSKHQAAFPSVWHANNVILWVVFLRDPP
jgi:hypothetical protein